MDQWTEHPIIDPSVDRERFGEPLLCGIPVRSGQGGKRGLQQRPLQVPELAASALDRLELAGELEQQVGIAELERSKLERVDGERPVVLIAAAACEIQGAVAEL